MIFFNKKGGGKILSFYWFIILILIAGGIFAMVYSFSQYPLDVREIETELLMNKVADCISYAGVINSKLISEGELKEISAFLDNCYLIFENKEYYVEAKIYKLTDMNVPFVHLFKGELDLVSQCAIQSEREYSTLAKCNKRSFYSVDDSNNQYIIQLLTIIRKLEKNVKI